MSTVHNSEPAVGGRSRGSRSKGMALVVTLLLLTIMVAMTLAMIVAVTSDTLITKYYGNARVSFYSADSGVNIARQYLINQLTGTVSVGTDFSTATQPIPSSETATALANLLSQYGSASTILGGSATGSWPSQFYVVGSQSGTLGTTLGAPNCTWSYSGTPTNSGPFTCTNVPVCSGSCSSFALTDVQYLYPYTITAIGQSIANEHQIVEDAGNITINIHIGPAAGQNKSFAAFGTFINTYAECSTPFAPGTLTGPFFTNGAWTFENSGSYTFTGSVGSVSSTFGWDNTRSGCTESATYPQTGFSTTFQSTVSLGATALPLPVNDYSQKEAVVDGLGTAWPNTETAAQMDSAMNAALKTYNGTAYPSSGTTNPGVYMAYTNTSSSSCPTPPCMTGGGIYVEGSANSVMLTAANPTISGTTHNQQVFTITQTSGMTTTTTTITVDLTSMTTTMASQTGSGSTTTLHQRRAREPHGNISLAGDNALRRRNHWEQQQYRAVRTWSGRCSHPEWRGDNHRRGGEHRYHRRRPV